MASVCLVKQFYMLKITKTKRAAKMRVDGRLYMPLYAAPWE